MRTWRLGLGLLVFALVAAWGSAAEAAIAHVQSVSCTWNNAGGCTTASITTTTGNLVVGSSGYCCFTNLVDHVTDSKSNSWSVAVANFENNHAHVYMAYSTLTTGGASHTFTVVMDTASYGFYAATEISGQAASPLDKTAVNGDASGTSHATPATSTTAQANELLVGVCNSEYDAGGTMTYTTDTGAGWVERVNISNNSAGIYGGLVDTKAVSATGAYTFTYTKSQSKQTAQAIATFKDVTPGGGGAVRQQCVGCGSDRKVLE